MIYSFHNNASPGVFKNARELRQNLTPAEKYLWKQLRARRFEGYKFRRQHPVGGYIVDFYCHKSSLVIEVDGQNHETKESKMYDDERTKTLEANGLRVIRFSNTGVLTNIESILDCIYKELNVS